MASSLAPIALLSWPVIGILLFQLMKDREKAVIWSFIASFLLLPSSFAIDLPAIPPLDKRSVPALTVLILVAFTARSGSLVPKGIVGRFFVFLLIFGQFMSAITNPDPLWVGRFLPGMTFYDAISSVVRAVVFIAPFLIGYACLSSFEAQRKILYALVLAALIYSVPMLLEVRLSPQFHTWVYGFFPHNFGQQFRGGGFRPVVFMIHGLYVAFFTMTACSAAAILWQTVKRQRKAGTSGKLDTLPYFPVACYLFFLLIICKSLGSLIFGILLLPCLILLSPRRQVWIAAALVTLAITYPISRGAGIIPTGAILEQAASISEERAASLRVRFTNEDALLAHAEKRFLFGWGGYGRNRIYDAETGQNLSTVDGYWVGMIGTYGWAGFLPIFGLLGWPIYLILMRYRGQAAARLSPVTSGLCLLLAINLIELLPNSTLFPWTWLIAGALWAHAQKAVGDTGEEGIQQDPKRPRTIL